MCAPLSSQGSMVQGKDEELDDDFFMFKAKVVMCPRQDVHSASTCPYLHPNELARRRDPRLFKYDSLFCADLHSMKVCRRGAGCPYSHNLFEYFLHPSRYRTSMCKLGEDCRRQICFFAHNESQLRQVTAIKLHSGGRRRCKRHKAAAAASTAAVAAASDLHSVKETDSLRLQALLSTGDTLPGAVAPDSTHHLQSVFGISDPLGNLTVKTTSRLSAGVQELPNNTTGCLLPGLAMSPAADPQREPQPPPLRGWPQIQQQPQLIQRAEGSSSAAGLVPCTGQDALAPVGYCGMVPLSSSYSVATGCKADDLPAGMPCGSLACVEPHLQMGTAGLDSSRITAGPYCAPSYPSQPQTWTAVLLDQQQQQQQASQVQPHQQFVLVSQQQQGLPDQHQAMQPLQPLLVMQPMQQLVLLAP